MDYKSIIESKYDRQRWVELLHDIFRSKLSIWSPVGKVYTNSPFAKQVQQLGTIELSDGYKIAIYEVELSDSVDIERNRRGLRDMLQSSWRGCFAGAFMFCYRNNESVLRFSYVSESWSFAEDGTYKKESTDTKRFTYLLGEGHRSRTAIQQFEKLRDSSLSLKDITKAFSIEAVGDMFFKGYKKIYEDIIFYVTGKRMVKVANKWEERQEGKPDETIMQEFAKFLNPEKAVRDYVKKLMGRLVFLQFLQKKGWLGVCANAEWGTGDAEFIQNLFAQTIDKDHFVDNVLEALFNDLNSEDEKALPQFRTPYLNGGLFERDAQDETNFPLPGKYMDKMLKFFGSYNFTIDENDPDDAEVGVDPEMLGRIFENLLEDNKDKGAFYTPKEIVTYMCRESLITYLQTDIDDEATKEAIRNFVINHDANQLGGIVNDVDQRLKDVKICDPAIGSGAFPMGLLKELFQCRSAIEGIDQSTAVEIKKHIIQNNIYGVDIEKGAVDIARLRFWLSLIVDEETPQALPNLDFKIMRGNSLLEQYNGFDLSTIMHTKKKVEGPVQMTLFEDNVDVLRRQVIGLRREYFREKNKGEKKNLRKTMRDIVQQQINALSYNIDLSGIDIADNSDFFLWHTWFSDVFEKGGFDIVIANPPYVPVKDEQKASLSMYTVLEGHVDLYEIFIERGMQLLNNKGVLEYINPNTALSNLYSQKLRRKMVYEYGLTEIVNFGMDVFEATVHTCILRMQKGFLQKHIGIKKSICNVNELSMPIDYDLSISSIEQTQNFTFDISFNIVERAIFDKLSHLQTLGDICFLRQCIKTGNDKVYVKNSDKELPSPWKKSLRGKGIDKYYIKEIDLYVKYGDWLARNWKNKSFYECEKIAVREAGNRITACLDLENRYFLSSLYAIYPKNKYDVNDLKILLAILNSKFATFFIHKIAFDITQGAFTKMRTNQLARLPIPRVDDLASQKLISSIDIIINCKQQGRESIEEEIIIDILVYHLYNLSYEEVLIVDPETTITKEEYES